MEYDYKLKCLDIDLSNQTYTVWQISAEDTARFIGGAGINSWLSLSDLDSISLTPVNKFLTIIR